MGNVSEASNRVFFRFLNEDEISNFNLNRIEANSSTGYILEVSLIYPPEIHDVHNDYPLAPEKTIIENDKLSPYARRIWNKLHEKENSDDLPKSWLVGWLVVLGLTAL